MYWIKRFGTTTIPTDLPEQDTGAGEIGNVEFLPLPGGGSSRTIGSATANPQARSIKVKGAISTKSQTPTALDTQFYALQALLGVHDKLYRNRSGDTTQWEWIYATCMKISAPRKLKNREHIEMDFTFQLEQAAWNGANHYSWTLDSGEYLDTGLYLDSADFTFALDASPKTVTVTNGGHVTVEDCTITVTAAGTAITALQIERVVDATTYEDLNYAGSIAAGQSLVIDTGSWSVENNAVDDYDNFSLGAGHKNDAWLRLLSGDNSIKVTKTGGSAASTITVEFYDGWR